MFIHTAFSIIRKGAFILKQFRFIFVFFVVLLLASCSSNVETDGFSSGFLYDSLGTEPAQEIFCGIHTAESINAIGPIQIEFYIGVPDYSFGNIDDLSSIIIYVINSDEENRVDINTITNFDINDFTYKIVENSNDTFSIEYTYSIETSIPESMFSGSEGMIEIGFEVLTADNSSVHFSTWNIISYVISDEKIEFVD